jgi:hypothetical protein
MNTGVSMFGRKCEKADSIPPHLIVTGQFVGQFLTQNVHEPKAAFIALNNLRALSSVPGGK